MDRRAREGSLGLREVCARADIPAASGAGPWRGRGACSLPRPGCAPEDPMRFSARARSGLPSGALARRGPSPLPPEPGQGPRSGVWSPKPPFQGGRAPFRRGRGPWPARPEAPLSSGAGGGGRAGELRPDLAAGRGYGSRHLPASGFQELSSGGPRRALPVLTQVRGAGFSDRVSRFFSRLVHFGASGAMASVFSRLCRLCFFSRF
ncbi:uncharacterized protein [Notamacropus eugenii]|uniref:uncharacterized protein n=1 Tax=Notamacropus eugenii TaxID=9315 RepID=UPI003B6701B7